MHRKAIPVPMITHDVDAGLRDRSPDIGADEFGMVSGVKSTPGRLGLQLRIKQNPIQSEILSFALDSEQKLNANLEYPFQQRPVAQSKNMTL